MRTDTLAIVFTDIKGYTAATSSQTHQENARMLRRVDGLVRPVIEAFNGRVVKSIGDAYMVVFRSPTESVRCATAVQDRLHQHNTNSTADDAIHIRIALNFGEVRVERGDVFGEPVNIAARIESVTPADEIYLSEALYLVMNRSDVATEVVGEYELKGIPEPVTVYRVRKFAHLDEQEDAIEETDSASVAAAGLPYGGSQLQHWKRLRWVRRAYQAMWALAILGLLGAGYLRYRPSSDYGDLVADARESAEEGAAMEVLAAAGQIPVSAANERTRVRPYRRRAVRMLVEAGQLDVASAELDALLAEDGRDGEALLLRAGLRSQREDLPASLQDLEQALKMDASLGTRQEVVAIVVEGYRDSGTRKLADFLVEGFVKNAAVSEMAEAVVDPTIGDRRARYALAERLEKLGAGHTVDWVALYIEDLKSTSCKVRKAAIAKLSVERDDRAVGPLMKVAEAKGCGAKNARNVIKEIRAVTRALTFAMPRLAVPPFAFPPFAIPPFAMSLFIASLVVGSPDDAEAIEYGQPGNVMSVAGVWLFNAGDNPGFGLRQLDDLEWKERAVPTLNASENARWEEPAGWYRLHLELNRETAAADLALALGPLRMAAEIYLNGSLVGRRGRLAPSKRPGAHALPMFATLPRGLLRDGDNVIAVRIYDPTYSGGIVAGPLLIGPPDDVAAVVTSEARRVTSVRLFIGLIALFAGILHLLLHLSGRAAGGGLWGVGAGTALAIAHLSGTGLFTWLPGIDFSSRLESVTLLIGILFLGRFFVDMYEDFAGPRVVITQAVLIAMVWIVALIPESWAFFASAPIVLLSALVATLYAANLSSQALRRREAGTLPVFFGLCVLAGLLVYDGFSAHRADVLPPTSAMGAVAVFTLTVGSQIRRLITEHATTLQRWVRLSNRLDAMPYRSVIDATTLPLFDWAGFLSTAIHEVARDLAVRRCSLVLHHNDDQLRIRASVGLPKHLADSVMGRESISGWAFEHDAVLSTDNLPDELATAMHGKHITNAFLTLPVRVEGLVKGVLNLADRNDGKDFSAADESLAADIAEKLGLSISLLPTIAFDPPPEPEVATPLEKRDSAPPKAVTRPQTVRMSAEEASMATSTDASESSVAEALAAAQALELEEQTDFDSPFLEDGALEDGALEDGALEDGALEDGALEDGALENAAQDGALDDGALEDRALDGALDEALQAATSFPDTPQPEPQPDELERPVTVESPGPEVADAVSADLQSIDSGEAASGEAASGEAVPQGGAALDLAAELAGLRGELDPFGEEDDVPPTAPDEDAEP